MESPETNMLPFQRLLNLLKGKFLYTLNDDRTKMELQYFIQHQLYQFGMEQNLRKEEIDLLKINIDFPNDATINIRPDNLFTACILFGKYIPSVFIPKNAKEIMSNDGSIISFDGDKYCLQEVDESKRKTLDEIKRMNPIQRGKYYKNLSYENLIKLDFRNN